MENFKRVVVIGPESTGKSSLCESLAARYNTLWCPEYAREYLLKNGTDYSLDNLLDIAKGQIALEEKYLRAMQQMPGARYLFIDTNMYVLKVWCEYVFGQCHNYILDTILRRNYDYYLLANIDLPWTKDELREYPQEKPRKELFHIYKDLLVNQDIPWSLVSHKGKLRTDNASSALEKFAGK